MDKERVKLTICGNDYVIYTSEEPEYVKNLGAELDETITKIMNENNCLSVTQAAILASLNYADEAAKATSDADNLRSQIKEYLEDSQRSKLEAEVARKELENLRKERDNSNKKPFWKRLGRKFMFSKKKWSGIITFKSTRIWTINFV